MNWEEHNNSLLSQGIAPVPKHRQAIDAFSGAVGKKALIEQHRASEHLFKPPEESAHTGSESYADKIKPQVVQSFQKTYKDIVKEGTNPKQAHAIAVSVAIREHGLSQDDVEKITKDHGLGMHKGETMRKWPKQSSKQAEHRELREIDEAKELDIEDAEAEYEAKHPEITRQRDKDAAKTYHKEYKSLVKSGVGPKEAHDKAAMKAAKKHGTSMFNVEEAAKGLGAGKYGKGTTKLKDPHKEQLARLQQTRSAQTGPKGGRYYTLPGGGKKYI
jgi:hypothetical protein